MIKLKIPDKIQIKAEDDILKTRQVVREVSDLMGFGIVNQTRLITAVSELVRNALKYAGKGTMTLKKIEKSENIGLMITVTDRGQGIPDIELAMKDGYSTSRGIGLGLGGAKRLVDEFKISSTVGKGTIIEIIKWVD